MLRIKVILATYSYQFYEKESKQSVKSSIYAFKFIPRTAYYLNELHFCLFRMYICSTISKLLLRYLSQKDLHHI